MLSKKQLSLTLMFFGASIALFAQQRPPIFDKTPRDIKPVSTLATFPKQTFLENLVLLPDGSMLVNSHLEGIVYKIKPSGEPQKFASVKGKLTGIAAYGKDKFVLTGNDENDKSVLFLLTTGGQISKLMDLPEAQFVNGITYLAVNDFLIADSYKGCIWKINAKTKVASIWLADAALERVSEQNPTPGVNGIKVFQQSVFISNTQKQQIFKVNLTAERQAGKPELYASEVNVDDFTFDVNGNLYATTHVYNSIIKITPDKKISVLAEQPQGSAGSTACVLKKTALGYTLFVSTNGGMLLPPSTGIEASKVLAISIQ